MTLETTTAAMFFTLGVICIVLGLSMRLGLTAKRDGEMVTLTMVFGAAMTAISLGIAPVAPRILAGITITVIAIHAASIIFDRRTVDAASLR